ncbi:MAG: ATP-binding protein [Alphaproteobacteria bacterium]
MPTPRPSNPSADAPALDAILDSLQEGVAVFDARDRLVCCNNRFRDLFPHLGQMIRPGVRFRSLVRVETRAAARKQARRTGSVEERLRQRMLRHEHPSGAFEQQLPDDRWIWVRERKLDDGTTISTYVDISDVKHRQAALETARLEAEAASDRSRRLLADVTHELRTPVTAIMGFSDLMREGHMGPLNNPRLAEYLKDIHDSGEHMLALINDLLDHAKLEAGAVRLTESEVSLADLATECTRMLKPDADRRGLTLSLKVQPLPPFIVDHRSLRQVLLNLLSNALKATPPGGRVSLRIARAANGDGHLVVRDSGRGMTAREIAIAFTPFGQITGSDNSGSDSGTGLGLPIARRLVELHGGRLDMTSRPGHGTTALVVLPAARARGVAANHDMPADQKEAG